MEAQFDQQLKNMKGVIFKEAAEFVKNKAMEITNVLSKQHQNIIKTFVNYRIDSEKKIDERDLLLQRWRLFEEAYCLRSPALEAEFVFDRRSAIGMYDCVIPQLKEYRKLEVTPELLS